MSRNRILSFVVMGFAAGLLMIAGASVGQCQTASGSIVGTVKDSSGAVIPSANVSIINQATNIRQQTITNALGDYNAPFLPVGVYTVRIDMTGFESMVRAGVVLRVGESLRVDVTLHPGNVTQRVTVSGLAPLLQTENASQGQVIGNDRIVNLPLLGRNFLELAQLSADVTPGASSAYNSNETVTLAQQGVSLSAEGQRDNETSFMIDGASVRGAYLGQITIVPPIDSIQEFKMQTTGYSALNGTSPVQLNVVTKSGTNSLHGSAYDFVRNTDFNARDPFAQERTPYHENQFGVSLGGPVVLPKIYNGKNKTFFFFAYEGTRNPVIAPTLASMPPAAFRNGDFSSLLPGRVIIDPTTGQPFQGNIIPKDRLDPSMQALLARLPLPDLPGVANNYNGYNPNNFDNDDYVARLDHQLTSRDNIFARYARTGPSLLGSVPGAGGNPLENSEVTQGGYNLLVSETHSFSPTLFNEFHYGYNTSTYLIGPQNAKDWGPILNWQGLPHTIGVPLVTEGFNLIHDQTPGGYDQKTNQFTDNLFIQKGAHSMTAGFDIFHKVTNPTLPLGFTSNLPYAWVVDTGAYTGYPFADFLLGLPAIGAYFKNKAGYLSPPMVISYPDFNFYFQDNWKVAPKLTLNLGLRYDLVPVLADLNGEMRNFDFQTQQLTPQGQVGNKYFQGAHKNFAPRFGFAYRITPKTVVRGGYGWFYGRAVDLGPTSLANNYPNALDAIILNTQPTPTFTVGDMFANVQPGGSSTTIDAISPTYTQTPSTQSWIFDVERQLSPTTLLTLQYAGSHTTHLDGIVDVNAPTPGPGPSAPRRPYPAFQSIQTAMSAFSANYNGGMVKLEKRLSHGVTFLGSYAWSKSLDQTYNIAADADEFGSLGGPEDRTNFTREWGPAGNNITNAGVFSFIYDLPFGPGGMFARSAHGVLGEAIGGWQFSTIGTFRSGYPITIRTGSDPANTGQQYESPDVVCNPNNVPGGAGVGEWFNTACFQNPPSTVYRYGNAGRGLVTSPGYDDLDVALMKNFKLGERTMLQFRGEFFNVFNHNNLGAPDILMQDSNFGQIGSDVQPRLGQVALKLLW